MIKPCQAHKLITELQLRRGKLSVGGQKLIDKINYSNGNIVLTFTCLTYGIGNMNSQTSTSPIDLERHKPLASNGGDNVIT